MEVYEERASNVTAAMHSNLDTLLDIDGMSGEAGDEIDVVLYDVVVDNLVKINRRVMRGDTDEVGDCIEGDIIENKRWVCRQCGKTFSLKHTLKMHTLTHKAKSRELFGCAVCWKLFVWKSNRDSHCLQAHGIKHQDVLIQRGVQFEKVNSMTTPADVPGAQLHSCVLERTFSDSWDEAKMCEDNKSEEEVVCGYPSCGARFDCEDGLSLHILAHHITQVYSCARCHKRFHCLDLLSRHERDLCDDNLSDSEQCTMIGGTLLSSDSATLTCHMCDKAVRSEKALERHLALHSRLPCGVCGKMLRGKVALERHKLVHETVKPFKCDSHCTKTFSTKPQLERHLMGLTGIRPYTCEICLQQCKTAADLKSHMVRHSSSKPYQCSTCGATFARNSQLTRHALTHTGERGHTCTACGKTFAVRASLTKHSVVHLQPEQRTRHACTFCNKLFSRMSHVNRHIRSVHLSSFIKLPANIGVEMSV